MHLEQNKRKITTVLPSGTGGTGVTLAKNSGTIFYKMTRITKPFVSGMVPAVPNVPHKNKHVVPGVVPPHKPHYNAV